MHTIRTAKGGSRAREGGGVEVMTWSFAIVLLGIVLAVPMIVLVVAWAERNRAREGEGWSVKTRACCYCSTRTKELRPYGIDGAWTCFGCATATPERKRETKAQFSARVDAAETASPLGVAVIGGDEPAQLGKGSA